MEILYEDSESAIQTEDSNVVILIIYGNTL